MRLVGKYQMRCRVIVLNSIKHFKLFFGVRLYSRVSGVNAHNASIVRGVKGCSSAFMSSVRNLFEVVNSSDVPLCPSPKNHIPDTHQEKCNTFNTVRMECSGNGGFCHPSSEGSPSSSSMCEDRWSSYETSLNWYENLRYCRKWLTVVLANLTKAVFPQTTVGLIKT